MPDRPRDSGREISPEKRTRAVELVEMIRSTIYSDEMYIEFDEELKRLIPHPAWFNLIFWHTPELSDEEVVEEALRYRPIEL